MAFSVGTLTAYTEQQKFPLLTKALFSAKSISMMTPRPGIKSSEVINIMETNARFQAGGSCAFAASGTTSLTQRTLTIGKVAIMEELCVADLEAYYIQTQLKAGSTYGHSDIPFEQQYTEMKAGLIAQQLETAVWQGDTTESNPDLARFDGLLKLIDAATGVIDATTQADIDSTTVRGIFADIYTLIPAALIDKEDMRVFCGWDTFRTLINKLTTDNLYHYTSDEAARSGEMYYPGTTLRIVAVHGLNGTDRIIAARTSNLFFGTDMMGEEEQFRFVDMRETDASNSIRFRVDFKAGTQIAFPAEIVSYQNT